MCLKLLLAMPHISDVAQLRLSFDHLTDRLLDNDACSDCLKSVFPRAANQDQSALTRA